MAKTMYWYNPDGYGHAIDENDGSGHYVNWFQDADHTTPCGTAAGLPTSGDTIYGSDEGPYIDLNGGNCNLGDVHIVAGTFIFSNGYVTLGSGAVVEDGVGLHGDGSANLTCGATFKGNLDLGHDTPRWGSVDLTTGWKVNNGAVGGSIYIETDGPIHISAAPSGSKSYASVTFLSDQAGMGDLDLSAMGAFSITGSFAYHCGGWYTPPGTITLNDAAAAANGVAVGHVPAINRILPSDNLFGVQGTAKSGGAPGMVTV